MLLGTYFSVPAAAGLRFHSVRSVVRPDVCPACANIGCTGQAAMATGDYIPVQKWNSLHGGQVHHTDAAAVASNDHLQKNGIVCRAGKSIIQTLLLGHQMTVGGLHISSYESSLIRK